MKTPSAVLEAGKGTIALKRLHEKGLIGGDPISKAKSVVLTPEGVAKSRELFQHMFGNMT